jgi:hypothetical protein
MVEKANVVVCSIDSVEEEAQDLIAFYILS